MLPDPSIVSCDATQLPATFFLRNSKPLPRSTLATTPQPTETLSDGVQADACDVIVAAAYPRPASEALHALALAVVTLASWPRLQIRDDDRWPSMVSRPT